MVRKTLVEVLPVIGAPRNRVENWLIPARLRLSSHFQQPDIGTARSFTRVNTLELAVIAAFVKASATASAAAAMAAAVLRQDKAGKVQEFWIFEAGEMSKGVQTDAITASSTLASLKTAWPPVLTIVRIGEIVRRVDALFAEAK